MSKGQVTLRDYEIVYIFAPSLEEAAVTERLEQFHTLLTGENGGEITATDHWGQRSLSYPIADQTSGYFVVEHFRAPAEALPEFERALKLNESVLRYLVVINEGNLATTPTGPVERRDDDADEGDE
jgi:small subunit ribosomal protein S6